MPVFQGFYRVKPGLFFILACVFMSVLWIAGGASRADVLGQVVVRTAAWTILVAATLFGDRPSFTTARPVLLLLVAALLLALLQLVPLPPSLWQALPGRAFFAEAAAASEQAQPWRPWSIVPGATINAASSLIVPLVVLILMGGLTRGEQRLMFGVVLSFVLASTLLGMMQFSGVDFENPFINESAGEVSGIFANRNHFALFAAFGCVLAPVWAFLDGRQPHWRGPAALGLVLLFVLAILASGSRAGLILGVLAVSLGLLIVRREIQRSLRHYPRWVFPASLAAIVAMVVILVLLSVAADRAVSINRALELNSTQDLRGRALPVILDMVWTYFPMGSGLGGFDPIFRIHEPFELLTFTYLNHAHNDFVEIALDAGLPGMLLLLVALLWWFWASVRAWRAGSSVRFAIPKLGSAILLLVIGASILDYPARTPMMMAMIVVAGIWLCSPVDADSGSALPKSDRAL